MKCITLIVGLTVAAGATALVVGDAVRPATSNTSTSASFAKAITIKSPVLYPYSLAAGDLTGNNIPDLAVVGVETTGLFHALGKGNGRFGRWGHDGGSGSAPSFVIFADLDVDGNLDALTDDASEPQVVISFGDGRGGFPKVKVLDSGVGYATSGLAVADLNRDGTPDIVGIASTVGKDFGKIFVLLGLGHREFQKPAQFDSGGYAPNAIAVGDLNHDGIPDLVVANYGTEQNGNYGNVAVLLGKGDGVSFYPPVRYPIGSFKDPLSLTLGDFNRDGNLDVAVTTENSDAVHVLLGRGDGTLSPPTAFPAGLDPLSIVAADFNGDGILDLAVTNYTNPKPCHVSVMLGNGDGTFQPPVQFRVGVSPAQLVVADFIHDGKSDIATINGGDSTISILLNTTQFPEQPSSPSH